MRMVRTIYAYVWECLRRAFGGSLGSALNWSSILGVGLLGASLEYWGATLTFGDGWQGIALSGIIYTSVAWVAIFIIRFFFIVPFQMWRDLRDRVESLEGSSGAENKLTRPPSFEIGFEYSPFDAESDDGSWQHLICRNSLRIWVENIEGRPIDDCRVAIESFEPDCAIKVGSLLIPDIRGAEDEKNARFELAATEKRYLKFIDLIVHPGRAPRNDLEKYGYSEPGYPTTYSFKLRTDQEDRGFARYLFSDSDIEVGKKYSATIVVHGKAAGSCRLNLTIEVMDFGQLNVMNPKEADLPQEEKVAVKSKLGDHFDCL